MVCYSALLEAAPADSDYVFFGNHKSYVYAMTHYFSPNNNILNVWISIWAHFYM